MNENTIYKKEVTTKNVLKFSIPTIIMTLFMSFYTMIDGLFVSNIIGTNGLSAINLTAPIIQFVTAISTMLATGGSAVIMKKIGENKFHEAKEDFTFLIIINIIIGLIMCTIGYLSINLIFENINISKEVLNYCKEYLSYYLLFTIPILLMNNFTLYMIACDKSKLSLICSVSGGITNIILDYIFLVILNTGIKGAAIATGLGYSITTIVGLFVFSKSNNIISFKKPVIRPKVLILTATNGCSEMANVLVTGIITLIFNNIMLKYIGEDGIAAVTIIMYVMMFISSLYSGYIYGIAPMISYYYGEKNNKKLKNLTSISLKIILFISILTLILSILFTKPLVSIFTGENIKVYDIAVYGNYICSIALLFIGFNIFSSGLFTALSNGITSMILAFCRSFVFMIISLILLPKILGINGIWLSIPFAEFLSIIQSILIFKKYKKIYNY